MRLTTHFITPALFIIQLVLFKEIIYDRLYGITFVGN